MRKTKYAGVDIEEHKRLIALAREQGWPYDPSIVQRDAGEKWWLPSSAEAGTVPRMPSINPIVPPQIVPAKTLQTPGGLGQPTRQLTQIEIESKADQNREDVEARSRALQNPNFKIQRGIGIRTPAASDLESGVGTRTPGMGERLQSLAGGVTGAVGRFFDDPRRVALVQAGLTAMDPGSYYDKEGFYSTFGGLNKALGAGVKTYKELSKPKELSFEDQEEIKHGYDIKLEQEKAKSKKPTSVTTKMDANKRLRYVDGPKAGELVYKDLIVEKEGRKSMDDAQLFAAERKLSREFVDATKLPRGQIDAYRRIESIFDDPMSPDPIARNSIVADELGTVSLRGFKMKDGSFFELDQGGAADLALIFNFMKMLDPDSVVRESEFALAEKTGGMKESIKAGWQKIMEGGRLSTIMRRNLMRQARVQYNSADEEMERQLREYTKLAKRYESMGIKSKRVYTWDRYKPTLPFSVFGKPTKAELDEEKIRQNKLTARFKKRLEENRREANKNK